MICQKERFFFLYVWSKIEEEKMFCWNLLLSDVDSSMWNEEWVIATVAFTLEHVLDLALTFSWNHMSI